MARQQLIPFVVCIVVVSLVGPAFCQGPDTVWTRTYGGTGDEMGVSVRQTSDGGYIIAGRTDSYGAGSDDVYLLRTDASGDTLWTMVYGGTGSDVGLGVQQTLSDNGYIVAGFTNSYGTGGQDAYLVKTDANGDTLWTRTYGGPNNDNAYSAQQTSDGGYIISGSKFQSALRQYDVWLIRTDANGVTEWGKRYGGPNTDYGMNVQQTPDDGFIVGAATLSFGAGSSDLYLVKTDSIGDTLWTRTYGGTGFDDGWCVDQTFPDNGYILAGYTYSAGAGSSDVYLVKTDANGDTLWTRTYGGADDEWAIWVEQTPDAGYILVGFTESFGAGAKDIYVIRTTASGDTLWTRTYGGASDEWGLSVQVTADGGYIVSGSTESYGAGNEDVYLLKIEDPGAHVRNPNDCPVLTISESAPNPFHSSARISFALPAEAHVDVGIYDIAGRLVVRIGSGTFETGPHTLVWDGTDSRGAEACPGIYFCRFKVGEWEASRKIVLVR